MWLVTRLRINDGATITIICCTNIHLSNPPIEELDTFIMWRCVIINYSPCVSSWLWGGCPARTRTRWAGRPGEAGRSRPSWEHKSPASRRSLQHQIIIIRVKSVNNSQTTEFSTKKLPNFWQCPKPSLRGRGIESLIMSKLYCPNHL